MVRLRAHTRGMVVPHAILPDLNTLDADWLPAPLVETHERYSTTARRVLANATVANVGIMGGNPVLAESAAQAGMTWKVAPAASSSNEIVAFTFKPTLNCDSFQRRKRLSVATPLPLAISLFTSEAAPRIHGPARPTRLQA
jgi:hypothetical protein